MADQRGDGPDPSPRSDGTDGPWVVMGWESRAVGPGRSVRVPAGAGTSPGCSYSWRSERLASMDFMMSLNFASVSG